MHPVKTKVSQLKNEIIGPLEEYDDVLDDLGEIKCYEVQLHIDENVSPVGITTTYSTVPRA